MYLLSAVLGIQSLLNESKSGVGLKLVVKACCSRNAIQTVSLFETIHRASLESKIVILPFQLTWYVLPVYSKNYDKNLGHVNWKMSKMDCSNSCHRIPSMLILNSN